jgi:Fic family protein
MLRASERAGYYVTQDEGYRAFEPCALPPVPPLDLVGGGLLGLLSAADVAVGRLDGSAGSLPDANLFLAMYVRQEALLSSQIEGTECTLDDVLAFELKDTGPLVSLDVGEVVNYVAALNHGVASLNADGGLPLCNRLLREVHATLLRSGRGAEKSPGEFRRSQNWIGPLGCSLAEATFVPPPVHVMKQAMSDLEEYLHDETLPPLLVAALAHAQFETIHPFLDGNGRTGRLLVSLLLHDRKVLAQPVLYLSTFLKANRGAYFERLMAVREEGDWENWIAFFLSGVKQSADMATATAERVHALREADRRTVSEVGGVANDLKLLDALYTQPIVDAAWVVDRIGVSPTTANKMLDRLSAGGILREVTGKKRYRLYRYDAYLALFAPPLSADRREDESAS